MIVRFFVRALAGGVLAGFVLLPALLPVSAQAAPARCAGPALQLNSTTAAAGDVVTVTGSGFCPDEDVTLTVGAAGPSTVHADARGHFVAQTRVSAPAGHRSVCASGATGLPADRACTALTVSTRAVDAASAGPAASGPVSSAVHPQAGHLSDGTVLTTAHVLQLAGLSVLLLGPGVAVAYAGRRRRLSAQS